MGKTIANPDLPAPPSGKYPAKAHARRVAQWIARNGGPDGGVIYLEGQGTKMIEVGGALYNTGPEVFQACNSTSNAYHRTMTKPITSGR